ncbi:hypothetical protein D9619_005245 [Psilocybe cf. subviscida]|uniref:Mid2 domain-containing protein n=1 Tax=Psilocybe cf. subviscida TaxID=2480587 RepID=A0A8H5BX89_9AGAR|nr:hypothetical protein D9619_005245 [Psilocybe cf. subviscida]
MRVIINLVHQALLFTVLFWSSVLPAIATLTNRTIDDTFGDSFTGEKVQFLPTTANVWQDQTCVGCAINPDILQAYQGTYTAATYNPGLGSANFTLNFHGTAIYVFFILANNAGSGITTLTALNFTLDDQPPQFKLHAPDVTTTDIQYNFMLFSQTGLPAAQHSLLVSTSGVDNDVYVNFDYAIYTHDDSAIVVPQPSSPASASASASASLSTTASTAASTTASTTASSSTPFSPAPPLPVISTDTPRHTSNPTRPTGLDDHGRTATSKVNGGAVAGGVIGALLAVALVVVILFLLRRRQKRLDTEQLLFKKVEIDPAEPVTVSELGHSNFSSESGHSGASMNPFHQTYHETAGSSTPRLTLQVPNVRPPPMSQIPVTPSEAGDPYDGYVTPTATSVSAYSNPFSNRPTQEQRPPLQLVNRGSTVPTLASGISNHEDLRRARQEELSRHLAAMQQEMMELSSGLYNHASGANGEGNGPPDYVKRVSVKSLRHLKTAGGTSSSSSSITAVGGPDGDAEVKVEDMKDLIRSMRLEIEYLQLQQQSAWAQGLSDDPPPVVVIPSQVVNARTLAPVATTASAAQKNPPLPTASARHLPRIVRAGQLPARAARALPSQTNLRVERPGVHAARAPARRANAPAELTHHFRPTRL